jgi:hypothetical protein
MGGWGHGCGSARGYGVPDMLIRLMRPPRAASGSRRYQWSATLLTSMTSAGKSAEPTFATRAATILRGSGLAPDPNAAGRLCI